MSEASLHCCKKLHRANRGYSSVKMNSEIQSKKEWIKPVRALLYHGHELVGTITNISSEDMFQWSGDIELTSAASAYKPMFDYFNDESREREPEEPDDGILPFDETLMDDWHIEDDNGRREILSPVVTDHGEVFWRD